MDFCYYILPMENAAGGRTLYVPCVQSINNAVVRALMTHDHTARVHT